MDWMGRMRSLWVVFFLQLLLLLSAQAGALEITSVSPRSVSSGETVTITGGPFGEGVAVIVGDLEIVPTRLGERQLLFSVPELAEGEYALFLREEDQSSPRTFTLHVTGKAPEVFSLSPSNIDVCSSGPERRVVVAGRSFSPAASLLLDGAAVALESRNGASLSFAAPALSAGVYAVQVVNPDGRQSLPHSLYFNDIPEILSVSQGGDFVSHYEIVIEGKNFFYNSTVVVSEYLVGFTDLPPQQRFLTALGRSAPVPGGQLGQRATGGSDNIRYVDCNTLIYNRYPYSTQPKDVTLLVVNPDGKRSDSYHLSIP